MIKNTLAVIAIVAAVIVLAEPVLARVDVKIDFDKNFNFTAVRTWRFDPAGNGEVKMARTQKDNPDAVKAVAEPIIVEAVNSEMQRLKLQTADAPDLIVRYFLLLSTDQTAQQMGQFLPATVSWGLPPFQQTTPAETRYTRWRLALLRLRLR